MEGEECSSLSYLVLPCLLSVVVASCSVIFLRFLTRYQNRHDVCKEDDGGRWRGSCEDNGNPSTDGATRETTSGSTSSLHTSFLHLSIADSLSPAPGLQNGSWLRSLEKHRYLDPPDNSSHDIIKEKERRRKPLLKPPVLKMKDCFDLTDIINTLHIAHRGPLNHGPLKDTNHGPLKDTNHGPLKDTNHRTLNGTNHGTLNGINHGPLNGINHGLLKGINHRPLKHTNHSPLDGITNHRPLNGISHRPLNGINHEPLKDTIHGPLKNGHHHTDSNGGTRRGGRLRTPILVFLVVLVLSVSVAFNILSLTTLYTTSTTRTQAEQ